MIQITPRVYQIIDTFVNLYVIVDDDGLTLIDTGFSRDGRNVLHEIKQFGRTPHDLKHILITHCDGDHVGGAASLKTKTGARVFASAAEAQAMSSGHSSREMRRDTLNGRLLGVVSTFMRFAPVVADELLIDGTMLPILDGLHVIATPGHTPGHMSFFAPMWGVLFSGDSIVSQNGVLQVSARANTWNDTQAIESVRAQAVLGANIVCTGHGPVVMNAAGKFPKL